MIIRRACGARSSDVRRTAVALAITIEALRVGAGSGLARADELAPDGGPVAPASLVGAAPSDDPFAAPVAREVARLQHAAARPEAVGPLVAVMELAETQPVGRFDPLIRRLVEQRGTDSLVAARARDWLAHRAEAEGDERAAASWRAPLGILSRLWVIGPFGEGRGSFGTAFPPEAEAGAPDPARAYQGKEREVGWRRGEGAVYGGALHLDALLRPDTEAVGYAEALVRVARPTIAALRIGSPGPIKIWCNGRQVFAADRARPARFDQDAVAVRLEAGWNRLLVKTVVSGGAWQLFARLTAPDGEALAFENDWTPTSSSRGAPQLVGHALPVRAAPARDLETILRRRARSAPARVRAEAWLDLGRYLMSVESADRDEKAAAAAFEASSSAAPSVSALLGLAAAGRDDDERRRALERALEVASVPSERARVLSALGDIARDQRRPAAAAELWRAALAADPHCWPASLSVAAEEQAADLTTVALARLDALAAPAREVPLVVRERARLLTVLGRREEAERELRRLLPHARDDIELLRELGSFAWDRGDVAAAGDALAEAARQRPDLPSFTVDLAHHLEGEGRAEEARRTLEQAARRMPHEFSLAAELGRLLDRQGQAATALTWLQTGRDLRPQDVDLRRYAEAARVRQAATALHGGATSMSSDDATGVVDLAKEFAAPVPELLARESARPAAPARSATGALDHEADPAVVLLDRRVVRVHRNGLAETFSQRLTAIRTEAGARDNKEFYVRYTPGSEEVEIREARIFRRDASGAWQTLQASGRDDQDLSEPWYGLYYDFRAEVVAFEGLRAGDVLEIEYVVSDVSRENQLAGYFGDLQFVAESIPKRRWDYTLLGPPGREFHFARPAVAHLESSVAEEHGEKVYRFAAADVPRVEAEPAMPGLAEVSPYLHVSTYGTWEEVGAWYWRLVEEQLVADDAIRRATASAIRPTARGPLTDLEKVRALHALVVGGTRYVGLEFGIHGFKPYKVAQIFSRRFGDCKDKAALLVVMLREAGIDAEMVLLRTRRGGRLGTLPASLAIFDHAIVFVPKLGLYLDGTAEFSGMDELPGQDQGVMVLRVGPHGAHLAQTPVLPPTKNRARRRWRVTVEADGSADVHEELTLTGQAAPEWREHYQTAGERSERYGKAFSARNPGAHLLSVEMPGIEDRNRPVTVLAHATVPGLGERIAGDGLKLGLGTREVDLARTYARLSERRAALVLAYPWQHDEEIDYRFPGGFEITHLPAPRRIESPFGSFELRTEKRGPGEVRVAGILSVERDRVSAAEYPAFRRFLATVDSIMAEGITAVPVPAHVTSAGPSAAVPTPRRTAVP